ncbi:chromosome partitioning protein ParB [Pseudonocardia alni]|uniref:ParB/RepB/Spo0J family partition protein n=1 Tax=Pseudonocardia alni TaxID=33907 RepID=UPI0024788D45|nr:chromosome partitioning protein ParB [Pseudonocardia alni]WFG47282.1 chromosome partitioning protein ParB [Pseudonocardia alni]
MTTEPTTELTTEATTEATVGTDDQPDTEFDTTRPGFDTSEALSTLDQLGELAWADPAELVLEVNTRTEVHLDPHFCASVRDRGVREPISVYRRDDGDGDGVSVLVVRKGQRRTLAALKAGLARVRVLIEPQPSTADIDTEPERARRTHEAERIIDQLTENQHRADISDAEQVTAHQQLLGLGMSAAQIARTTRTPAKRVRQTTAVARNPHAVEVGARYDLDLVQMSVIAEFSDDDDAVAQLTETALQRPHHLAHTAQRLRDTRAERALCAELEDQLREDGVTVLSRDDAGHDTAMTLARLRPSGDDPSGTELTEDAHRDCPGHAATVTVRFDFDQGRTAHTLWVCTDPATHGHVERYDRPSSQKPAAPVGETDEQRQTREDREREAARETRRTVIANNKAWESAQVVRRDWLRELFARKAAPKGAAIFVAAEFAQGDHDLRRAMETGNALAATLLGLGDAGGYGYYSGRPNPIAEAARSGSAARATMLALALVLAAYEAGTTRDSWRNPTPATRRYFAQLRDWGYVLADVEQLVLTGDTTDVLQDPGDDVDVDEQDAPEGEEHTEAAALG